MNLYIPLDSFKIFEKKLKELQKYDDYYLDGNRFGKQKVCFPSARNAKDFLDKVFPILPENSAFVHNPTHVEKDYMLCIGTINSSNLHYLKNKHIIPSVVTKRANTARLNIWVSCSYLEEIRVQQQIQEFSSMKSVIVEKPYFVFSTFAMDSLLQLISPLTNEYIISKNKMYVNLSLNVFCQEYNHFSPLLEKVEIVDKNDF